MQNMFCWLGDPSYKKVFDKYLRNIISSKSSKICLSLSAIFLRNVLLMKWNELDEVETEILHKMESKFVLTEKFW